SKLECFRRYKKKMKQSKNDVLTRITHNHYIKCDQKCYDLKAFKLCTMDND
ncbi:hypothetical protein ACJMK2_024603, partial [Sinanodonta woodiana]